MWSILGSIATFIGLDEIAKMIEGVKLTSAQAEQIALELIKQAESKSSALGVKVANMVSNVPQLAGSPMIKDALMNARQQVNKISESVEKRALDMQAEANKAATKIRGLASRSLVTEGYNKLAGKRTAYEEAQSIARDAANKISQIEKEV